MRCEMFVVAEVCVGKLELDIKTPGAFGGTTEMTQVTMTKLRVTKNLTRIFYSAAGSTFRQRNGSSILQGEDGTAVRRRPSLC